VATASLPQPEATVEKLRALARRAYKLGRIYPSALDVAYGSETSEVSVSTGNIADPTLSIATDRRKAELRQTVSRAAALVDLADRATAEALRSIQQADRLPGERVGRSWDTASAQDAEDRSTRKRAARKTGRRR
jgi:hypothetical protein